jgi:hypothetical protein
MSDSDEVRAQVETALIGRLLPAGMWGDFWITEGLHDPTPRLFPLAIVLFSFTVLHENVSSICGKVFPVADRIEEKLVLSMNLSSAEAAIGAAALLSVKGQSVGRKALDQMANDALAHRFRLDERGAYFFDYEYSPDADGQSFFGRDYFIIPVEILFGIAGFQRGAPSSLRLMAEGILSGLVENLRGNGGVYRPAATDRLSTIDQVWAAILLKVAAQAHTPPSVYEKVWYKLIRERRDNWFTSNAFPALSMLGITALNTLAKDAGPSINLLSVLASLVIGGLYGPAVLRRLMPGRK